MYHFHNQQLYHHNPYEQCSINIEATKLQDVNTISEPQYHQVLQQNNESNAQLLPDNSIGQPPPRPEIIESVKKKKTALIKLKSRAAKGDECNKAPKKAVDTSNYSIEERLVAAVWVHERKHTTSTISEIKYNFRRRFGRDPPSKTTLFAWERKLFSTGNVCDAPRTGRPVHRKRHISEVAASVRAAPALSLRARATALRLSRSTLHTILRRDLSLSLSTHSDKNQPADMQPPKRRVKQPTPAPPASAPATRPPMPMPAVPPHMHYVMHAVHSHTHGHGYT